MPESRVRTFAVDRYPCSVIDADFSLFVDFLHVVEHGIHDTVQGSDHVSGKFDFHSKVSRLDEMEFIILSFLIFGVIHTPQRVAAFTLFQGDVWRPVLS
jgi:hypothetical protein